MLFTDPYRRYYSHEIRDYRGKETNRFALFQIQVEESDLQIGISPESYQPDIIPFIRESLQVIRRELEEIIRETPDFLANLTPAPFPQITHPLARQMILASEQAGTGPMAAVAGAISEYIGSQIIKYFNPDELFVENGGDIFLKCNLPLVVGIGAGSSPLSGKLGFFIEAEETPLGICTSSGKVGPSLSFGQCDAATVIAKNAALSDAFATALGNRVSGEEDIKDALAYIKSHDDIFTALVILDQKLGVVGHHQLSILKK